MNKEEIGSAVLYRTETKGGKKAGGSYKEEYFNFLHLKFPDNRRAPVTAGWRLSIGVMHKEFCTGLMLFG